MTKTTKQVELRAKIYEAQSRLAAAVISKDDKARKQAKDEVLKLVHEATQP